MTPKRQRLVFVLCSVALVCASALMMMQAFRDNIVFFRTPSELLAKPDPKQPRVRIGGLVELGSVTHNGDMHRFSLGDGNATVTVEYSGLLPALFREGQGIVAEGRLTDGNVFKADNVLAKHDENYMPREVVEALKKSGHWHELPPAERGNIP